MRQIRQVSSGPIPPVLVGNAIAQAGPTDVNEQQYDSNQANPQAIFLLQAGILVVIAEVD